MPLQARLLRWGHASAGAAHASATGSSMAACWLAGTGSTIPTARDAVPERTESHPAPAYEARPASALRPVIRVMSYLSA